MDIVDSGLKIVLANNVAQTIGCDLEAELTALVEDTGAAPPKFFVAHPGGPRVIQAACAALGVEPSVLSKSAASLAAYGNLGSAAVLFVLADTLQDMPPEGSNGALFAVGPGFSAELALLRARSVSGERCESGAVPLVADLSCLGD